MSFDSSRFTYDSWYDFLGVVMQQGRVQLDSEWNEFLAEFLRRVQAGTLDTFGRAVYPLSTPYAFKINPSQDTAGNHIKIGVGRMYVDGLLVENHGPPATSTPAPTRWEASQAEQNASWDPMLAELSNTPPGAAEVDVDYTLQPYLPGFTPIPSGNGTYLFYLDVWQRAVTYVECPELVEKAVGVDTTGRLQTVWQVKFMSVPAGSTCSSLDSYAPWQALIQPSAGRLTNKIATTAASGPCCLTSNTGFTGLENQLYRVEAHQPPAPPTSTANATASTKTPLIGTIPPIGIPAPPNPIQPPAPVVPVAPALPTYFKWSRDNASVATEVTAITPATSTGGNPASQLTVQSMGRDQVLGFAPGNWIEITDDYLELNGQPGELHKIDSIYAPANTITLVDTLVNAGNFPLTNSSTDPTRHTRIRRWDQSGQVFQVTQSGGTTTQTLYWNLDNPANTTTPPGTIPVPPANVVLLLENGITISFSLSPPSGSTNPGNFHNGDFWTFAARTDGTIQSLTQAPPRGIHHHFAKLAVVTFPSTALNCRNSWPRTGIHVTGIQAVTTVPNTQNVPLALQNDMSIPISTVANGLVITITCDGPVDPNSVQPATCFLSVNLPVINNTQGNGNSISVLLGGQPMVLSGDVTASGNVITMTFLPNVFPVLAFQYMTPSRSLATRLQARLTLKGRFIWALGEPTKFLDGMAFGVLDAKGKQIDLNLPSGSAHAPGSDLELWFWLTRSPSIAPLVMPSNVTVGASARITVNLDGFAPPGVFTVNLTSSNSAITLTPSSLTFAEGQYTLPVIASVPPGTAPTGTGTPPVITATASWGAPPVTANLPIINT